MLICRQRITPPTVAEGDHLDLRITASDPDGDVITLTAELLTANMAFADSSGGVAGLTFDPDYTQSGVHQIRFIAESNTLADTQLVDITVTETDRPPVIDPITPPTLAEGDHLDLRITASDPDGDVITLTAELLTANMAFADSTGGVAGLTFDPDYTQSGVHQVRFIAASNTSADTQLVDITVTNNDRAPVLNPITPPTLAEGDHLDLRITASDPDGDVITLTAELLTANMAFADSSGGVGGLTFDPDYTQSGVHQVRFIAESNTLADTQLVDITVTETDRPPVIDPITPPTLAEGDHLDLRITASDPDGDVITLTAELLTANMAFTDSSGGVAGLTFDPDYTQSGVHQVRFIAESNTLADTQLVDITVTHTDLPPVIDPVPPQIVDENSHLDVRITASDFDGDPISLFAELLPANAAFVDSSGGVGGLSFDPDFFQAGDYQVRIIANSNTLSDTQFVDITVNNVNRVPVLNPIGNRSVLEGDTLTVIITASDPDLEIPSLLAEDLPVNAVFIDSANGKGSFTFSPDYTQSGGYDITFIATDGDLADSETVTVTVIEAGNQAPQIDYIGPQTVIEGEHLEFLVTANDPDSTIPVLLGLNLPANAAFADSGNGIGLFTFDPDYGQASVYNVLFRAYDGGLYDSLWVEITVIDSNRAPVLDPIGPQAVTEGDTLQFVVSASDIDGTTPGLSAENLPLNATFEDSLNGHGLFVFTPDFTQSGIDTVLFIAADGLKSDSEYVEITINEFGNNPPVLAPIGPQSVDEGSLLQVSVSATDADSTIPSLTAENLPAGASFIDSLNGNGLFEFTPDYFQSGVHTVRFIASDGSAADTEHVDITVNNINRAPVLDSIATPQAVAEGDSLLFTATASDVDLTTPSLTAEGLPANATFIDNGDGTADFRFLPDYFQSGPYQVLFIASDGDLADSQYADITVTNVNRVPTLDPIATPQSVAEGDSLLFTATASDPDLTTPSLTAEGLPPNATFIDNGDGTGDFRFLPDYFQSGLYSILFIASDGDLADSQSVNITVTNVNRAPVLDSIATPQTIDEGDSLLFTATASDPDLTTPALTAEGLPANATFIDNGDGTGDFRFLPDYFQSGPYQVLFIASDGSLADSQYVDITVNNVNRAPVLDPIPTPQTVVEGDSLLFTTTASDLDLTTPALTAEGLPANATFIDNGDGTGDFRFLPDFTQAGLYQILFMASDGDLVDSQYVDITVTEINRPPVLDSIATPQTVAEGDSLLFTAAASDADLTIPSLTAEGLPANAAFNDNGDGTGDFRFLPDYFQSGPYQVLFIASDGDLADSQYVDITVTNINRSPVLDPIATPQTVVEGDSLLFTATAGDPDLTTPVLAAEGLPENAAFIDNGDGTGDFRFLPDYFQSGAYQVLFIASDGDLADSQYVDITVTEINRAPVLDPIPTPQTVVEGDSLLFTATASDPDLTTPSLTAEGLPANATFIDNGDGTGNFRFLPDYAQSGAYQVLFAASDGDLADSQYVDINVTDVNLAPILDPITSPPAIRTAISHLFRPLVSPPTHRLLIQRMEPGAWYSPRIILRPGYIRSGLSPPTAALPILSWWI